MWFTGTQHPLPTFRDLIASNRRKSAMLLVGFCVLTPFTVAVVVPLSIGALAGPWLQSILSAHEEVDVTSLCLWIAAVAGMLSLVYCALMYARGDEIVLRSVSARPVDKEENPELYHVVEEMALAGGLPMPQICMIDDPAANAMATGRDPFHATIAVTTGLQKLLTRDELQAVIAHEMGHIRNYDTCVMLLASTLVGSVRGVCEFFLYFIRCILGGRHDERCPRWLGVLCLVGIGFTVVWLGAPAIFLFMAAAILLITAPISAHLVQLALSREREYLADASAVELTRYPRALADALWKLAYDRHRLRAVNGATAHLFISNPFKRARLSRSAFASHPPLKERIRRLAMLG